MCRKFIEWCLETGYVLRVCCSYFECAGCKEVTMIDGDAGYTMNTDSVCPKLVNSRETWTTPEPCRTMKAQARIATWKKLQWVNWERSWRNMECSLTFSKTKAETRGDILYELNSTRNDCQLSSRRCLVYGMTLDALCELRGGCRKWIHIIKHKFTFSIRIHRCILRRGIIMETVYRWNIGWIPT